MDYSNTLGILVVQYSVIDRGLTTTNALGYTRMQDKKEGAFVFVEIVRQVNSSANLPSSCCARGTHDRRHRELRVRISYSFALLLDVFGNAPISLPRSQRAI